MGAFHRATALASSTTVAAVPHLALLCEVDPELSAIQGVAVELLDSAFSFAFVGHLDESKATRPAGFAVERESYRLNRSGLTE